MSIYVYLIFLSQIIVCLSVVTVPIGPKPCSVNSLSDCVIDSYLGTNIMYEDNEYRLWDLTLKSGQMTSMRRFDCECHFVCVSCTTLEIYNPLGNMSVIHPDGVMGFRPDTSSDDMVPIDIYENSITFSKIHAAKNVDKSIFKQIIYESKTRCSQFFENQHVIEDTSEYDEEE